MNEAALFSLPPPTDSTDNLGCHKHLTFSFDLVSGQTKIATTTCSPQGVTNLTQKNNRNLGGEWGNGKGGGFPRKMHQVAIRSTILYIP